MCVRERGKSDIDREIRKHLKLATYTTFPKLLRIDRRCKVETPGVICHGILPIDKAF